MPSAMLGLVGVTAISTSVAGFTVRVVLPETAPVVAVIVVVPAATVDARPLVPAVLLIVETTVDDELQITDAVMS
jgi:hypothetical protein